MIGDFTMAQALVETIFDVCYLFGVITAGIIMVTKGGKNQNLQVVVFVPFG